MKALSIFAYYLNNKRKVAPVTGIIALAVLAISVTGALTGSLFEDQRRELAYYDRFAVVFSIKRSGLSDGILRQLKEHPAVADAAVIGKPDHEAGEVPKAFVAIKHGVRVDAQELIAFVASKVATFKQVRDVEFVDSIPKNPSGKILRRVLIEQERNRRSN